MKSFEMLCTALRCYAFQKKAVLMPLSDDLQVHLNKLECREKVNSFL